MNVKLCVWTTQLFQTQQISRPSWLPALTDPGFRGKYKRVVYKEFFESVSPWGMLMIKQSCVITQIVDVCSFQVYTAGGNRYLHCCSDTEWKRGRRGRRRMFKVEPVPERIPPRLVWRGTWAFSIFISNGTSEFIFTTAAVKVIQNPLVPWCQKG